MAANDLNISDLTFEGIKTSLVNYLKTQDAFKDYNFEGSGIKTLVDLLAYNTFYYGYYANMMASEMFLDSAKLTNSMISLTKPLGYLVPGALSAKSTVKLTNTNFVTELSPFSTFRGRDISGRPYFFYNTNAIPVGELSPGFYGTDYFEIYEGKSVTFRQLIDVDQEDQSFVLNDVNIDPRTIKIEVRYNGEGDLVSWTNYLLNPETVITSDTEIFFLERTKSGYNVNFGKYTFSDTGSVGKQIGSLDEVYVSYLVSSGAGANGISNISFIGDSIPSNPIAKSSTQLEVYTTSIGGSSQPDLDEIRFFAPKSFAKQNRVVTKNDYIALMNELGYKSNGNPDLKFKIFGGEEAIPPAYGRVFVSILNLNAATQINEINQVLSTLKDKSVVSILPEYLAPVEIKAYITASFALENDTTVARQNALAAIRYNLGLAYSTKKFNTDINKFDILNIIKGSYSGIEIFSDDIKVTYETTIAQAGESVGSVGRRISLKNKLSSVTITGVNTSFTAKTAADTEKYLFLYANSNGTRQDKPIGEVYFEDGIVIIYPEITSNSLIVDFEITSETLFAKDQLVCFVNDVTNDIDLSIRELV
jgi:hypothetical protein